MEPALIEGGLVIGFGWFSKLKSGDIVVFEHNNMEKIKRIQKISGDALYVTGDNPEASTDSRQFGWVNSRTVTAKILH